MHGFGMRGAWSLGYGFVAARPIGHAVILIGLGILLPYALHYALPGEPAGTGAPLAIGRLGAGLDVAAMLVTALGFLVQTGSFFASWRLGFDKGGSPGRALGYGLVAGLLAIALFAAVGVAAALVARQAGSSGAPVIAMLVFMIPLLAVFAMVYTTVAATAAAAVALLLGAAMAFGAATGQVGLAATLVGGSVVVVVVLLVLSAVLIWLAARFSCTTALMAARGSFNLIAAARDSWRLTGEEQWAILRYLALIGFGIALVAFALAAAAGIGASPMIQEPDGLGPTLLQLAAAVPLAFLTVLVPAGIHRELSAPEVGDVFA